MYSSQKYILGVISLFLAVYFCEISFSFAQISIIKDAPSSILFTSNIQKENIGFENITNNSGEFLKLHIPNYFSSSQKTGAPCLPVFRKIIEIPSSTGDFEINIKNSQVRIVDLNKEGFLKKIIPYQESLGRDSFQDDLFCFDSNIYLKDDYFEFSLISIEKQGIMRGRNMALLTFSPIQYNPVRNELKIFENVEIQISFQDTCFQDYTNKKNTLNPSKPIKYVIVSDTLFRQTLKPFVQWKMRQGFEVIELYTNDIEPGSSPQNIRQYLKNMYDQATPQNPAPLFLLLVGDVEQLAAFEGKAQVPNSLQHYTDFYYTEFTDDYLPEMIAGRFPAKTTEQLENMVYKSIKYEQYHELDKDYLNKTVLVSGFSNGENPLYSDAQMNYLHSEYLSENKKFITKKYLSSESNNKASEILDQLDSGMVLINFSGHCMSDGWKTPTISTTSVAEIANDERYPTVISNCCLSANFVVDECFGEALLRSKNGAIGYIGATDNTFAEEDFYWSIGIGDLSSSPTYDQTTASTFDYWLHEHEEPADKWAVTQGKLVQAGNLSVATGSPSKALYYAEIYHLLGDPSLMPFLKKPSPLYIHYNKSLFAGEEHLQFITEPYTYVALSTDATLLAAAMSDTQGIVNLYFSPIRQNEKVYVFASKQFKIPYIDTLVVGQALNNQDILPENDAELIIHPNPTKSFASIDILLPSSSTFTLQVYSMDGILQETLFTGMKEAGIHQFFYHKKGIYLCVFTSERKIFTKKMIISN